AQTGVNALARPVITVITEHQAWHSIRAFFGAPAQGENDVGRIGRIDFHIGKPKGSLDLRARENNAAKVLALKEMNNTGHHFLVMANHVQGNGSSVSYDHHLSFACAAQQSPFS